MSLLTSALLAASAVAFVDVNVLPMDEDRVLEKHTVVVRDGRIAELGPSAALKPPADATVVEGRGRFLMPGIAEMHGHLPGPDVDEAVVRDLMFLFVANGVTLVRGMQGHPGQLALRERIQKGEMTGPTLVLGSPALSGRLAPDPDTGRRLVRDYAAAGFDLVKILEGLSVETYEAITAEARQTRLPFGGHVPNPVGLMRVLEAKQATIDHLDGYVEALEDDESKIPALVEATKKSGTAVVPTMALWQVFHGTASVEVLAQRPEVKFMPAATTALWAAQRQRQLDTLDTKAGRRTLDLRDMILKALSDGGVPILMGSDAPQLYSVPGFSLHREMKANVAAGLTPYQVLRSGTFAIAEHLGGLETFGTVRPGRRADLILLEADPRSDIGHMERRVGVMVRGEWLPEEEIQKRLKAMAR